MMKRISISVESAELGGNGDYTPLVRRLSYYEAVAVGRAQWILQTSLSADEITRDLDSYIDPADHLTALEFASMSSRNLMNADKIERGAA
jgi:hypothetical protein